jgi:hypothetical protein
MHVIRKKKEIFIVYWKKIIATKFEQTTKQKIVLYTPQDKKIYEQLSTISHTYLTALTVLWPNLHKWRAALDWRVSEGGKPSWTTFCTTDNTNIKDFIL